jgi:transposase
MVRRHIDRNVKLLVLRMRERASAEKIKVLTGISGRSVRRWVALNRTTGNVVRIPVIPGRPRLLSGLDAAVSLTQLL